MVEYIVSARKYRPMTFDSVVGQSALTTTLKNAVKSGKLAHAYLFCGPRGVGKTTCARIFAKVINCLNPTPTGDACGECESCKAFDEGRSLNIFELDAASNNGVEQIKQLMEQTRIPPQTGKYKVFIIDEVHMLSTQAFNAFLKTLEEPPQHVIFILATTEKHKILPTIISRCQIYDFERMTVQNIINHLKSVAEKEGYTYEDEALNVIAEKADGGMRDALSIFDQAASFCQGNITYEKVLEDLNVLDADNYFKIIDLSLENKVSDIMVVVNDLLAKGFDGIQMVNGLASHVRNVLMATDPQTTELIEASDSARQRYAEQAKRCKPKFLYQALKILNQCDLGYRQSSNKRLLVELTLIQVAQITQEDDGASSGRMPCKRLKSLFKKLLNEAQPKMAAQVAKADTTRSTTPDLPANDNATSSQTGDTTPDTPNNTPKKGIKLSGIGVSLHNMMLKKEDNKKKEDLSLGEAANESSSFTDDDLRREWLSMCNRMMGNRQYNALAKRMMNASIKTTEMPHAEVIVENTLLLNDIQKILPRIKVTMAQRLHNGNLDLTLRLAEPHEIAKRLTPQEFLQKLTETYPSFASFKDEMKLEIER
ncbi:MAG: DNA polymerase III subunit gamma/tau [Prevotella sp.]|nr:DNA polymerase III subunit gamma/tau [Prevotella sp.]